jgi:FAD dependent oxidoreductase
MMLSRREILTATMATVPGLLLTSAAQSSDVGVGRADVIVYGATPGGIIAAVEAASYGLKAIIVGGWRETHLGGMMSGGLSKTDFLDGDAFGGRVRDFFARIQQLRGEANDRPDSGFDRFIEESGRRVTGIRALGKMLGVRQQIPRVFEPHQAEIVFNQLVKESGVSVRWTHGVDQVRRQGARITQFSTTDGQVFHGKVFIDASYEGDLLAKSGVKYEVGRGPANEDNPLDGFRGLGNGSSFDIDPFVTPGNSASGLISGVRLWPQIPVGTADSAVEAYNFRMSMTTNPARRLELPSFPPPDYDKFFYEILFRHLAATQAAGTLLRFRDLVKVERIGDDIYDVNNGGTVFSTDAVGLSWEYPEASYALRERIWKAHENYIRGFFYALAYENDLRVPPDLRAEVRQWGLVKDQFTEPHPNDTSCWPYQLYIREARRMVGDIQWTASDLNRLDGLPARSSKIIAMASYWEDSHFVQRLAYQDRERSGWRLCNEGGLLAESGGHDTRSPLPLEIILPRR